MATIIKKPEEIRDVLVKACTRRELLILATPFLRFETSFLALEGDELHVLATMSREDAIYGLRGPDLKLRFPFGLGFYEAPAEALGMGMRDGRRTVRLTIPKTLKENDQRTAYRVERVGRVPVTFSTPRHSIHVSSLVDISTSGARLHSQRDISPEELRVGDRILLDIPLSPDIQIQTAALVRHCQTRRIGLEFVPGVPPQVEDPLSKWVFLRREEERERAAMRLEQNLSPEFRPGTFVPQQGILLMSSDPALEDILRETLKAIRPLSRLVLSAQDLREALMNKPALAIFHVQGTNLDERRRVKALVEMVQRKAPILLLGTDIDGAALFELSSEWKASSAMVWSPERTLFLQRLVQGILRRHADGGDSPMAPREEGL